MENTNINSGVNASMKAVAGPTNPDPTSSQTTTDSTASSKNEGNAFASGTSGPSLPPVSLPSGGGAIRGMGENISMNAVQGTASFSIPLDLSQSRQGSAPKLSLQYDSGGGGSVWGMGWNLSGVIDVSRQTRLGLPRYEDGEREDVFVISGADDLVPVYLPDAKGNLLLDENPVLGFTVRQYRPRIEGLFSRIERWTDQLDPENVHWRMISPTNEIIILGRDENSRITSPNGNRNIFSWLCCEWYDCLGNARMYEYKQENGEGVDLGQANERNRTEDVRKTQRHLKRVKYGNRTAIADRTMVSSAAAKLDPSDWMFEVVFDYGEHDLQDPKPMEKQGKVWTCRKDPFSSFKSCFEVRTYRLCRRVLMFHHFPDEKELGQQDYLVKALEIEYEEGSAITYMKSARQASFVLRSANDPPPVESDKGSPYFAKRLPPLVLAYTQLPTEEEMKDFTLQELDSDAGLENAPEGVQGSYQWLDLLCEGINGILFTDPNSDWYYKRNLSAANELATAEGKADPFGAGPMEIRKPKFGTLERVGVRPSLRSSGPRFLDLEGDGRLNFAVMEGPTPGFYRKTASLASTNTTENAWEPFQAFNSWPTIDTKDPNLTFIDVTGDGKADILISQDDLFVWYESLGGNGFASAKGMIPLALDEEKGPRILFSDSAQTIHFADLSGDGMVDIVRIRNEDICYWPNMGYGRFGAMVAMDNAPIFDNADAFSFRRLVLGDIDGSGTTDLIYLHDNTATIYYNLAGNAWSDPLDVESLAPVLDSFTTVAAVDLLGSGTMCLVWSLSHPTAAPGRSIRYVDLSGGQKPHLLNKVTTNMGMETRFIYRPSTAYYLDDLSAGTPWATRLPYPQHCIDRVITYDRVSKVSFSQRYRYHHGYYDSVEREFRGFGMVEHWDTEQFEALNGPVDAVNQSKETHVPPAHTKSWFHTGAFLDHEMLSRAYAKEYVGAPDPKSSTYTTTFEKFFDNQLRDQLESNPETLTYADLREASRAFKGALLREEIYADDGGKKSGLPFQSPYQITDCGNSVRMLQPRTGKTRHGVFQIFEREKLISHLERDPDDPRIEHSLTLDVDVFGNVHESAALCYGRRLGINADSKLEERDIKLQKDLRISYSQNDYTNLVLGTDDYRVPHPSRARTWEVTNFYPADTTLGRFTAAEFAQVKAKEGIPFDQAPHDSLLTKRLLEHAETKYRQDDLGSLLDVGQQQSLGLQGINYWLCLTSSMISGLQGDGESLIGNVPNPAAILRTGGYDDRDGKDWWIPSSRTFYHRDPNASSAEELLLAKASFFTPRRVRDEFGKDILMRSDLHLLSYVEIEDQAHNIMTGEIDYRTLQLHTTIDPNGNRTKAMLDALGLVVGIAVMGKEGELLGDSFDGFRPNLTDEEVKAYFQNPNNSASTLLAGATSRFVYDVDSYQKNGANLPISASTIVRETHLHDQPSSTLDVLIEETTSQISVSYVDGYHRDIQVKAQAEPHLPTSTIPRWRGTGWTVFNNKGLPVQKFEPFFDDTHKFQFDRREGVSSYQLYDPMYRPIGIVFPNATWSKEVYGAWSIEEWDSNDTVKMALEDDDDVGPAARFLPAEILGASWFEARENGQKGPQEQIAAMKTMAHKDTPTLSHFDCLGREFLVIKNNGKDGIISTRTQFDISGNVLETRDGLDRVITTHTYTMCGHNLLTQSADSGSRLEIMDIHGKVMFRWDSRGTRLRTDYDDLRRPTNTYSQTAGKESLVEKNIYGENERDSQAHNLRGKVFRQFDQAGVVTHPEWDFKGNELLVERQFAKDYKSVVDWMTTSAVELELEVYPTRRTFDALNRVITIQSPDKSMVSNAFNKGGLLHSVSANLKGDPKPTPFVVSSQYDAHCRLVAQTAGNNTITTNAFDLLTQRLVNRTVVRQDASRQTDVQNLTYTYDPVGNVIFVQNDAEQTVFFRNGAVEPHSEYTYDALYRLTEAMGREHVGQTKGLASGPGTATSSTGAALGDGNAIVGYVEHYTYDAANCMTTIHHELKDSKFPGWTRRFFYQMENDRRVNNRLISTTVGNLTESYTYDSNGNLTNAPHLSGLSWDFSNQLRSSSQQIVADGVPETTWYLYNGKGRRVRKVTERQAATNEPGSKLHERLIIDGYEMYRRYSGDGKEIIGICETLHVTRIDVVQHPTELTTTKCFAEKDEDSQVIPVVTPVALVEDWSGGGDDFRLIRYQLQDHLDSISVELDENGVLLSYEEFMPYGSTAYYLPVSKAPKRFRFAGKERDTESGFYYSGRRYYIPWLARWLNPDPIGIKDGLNVYEYVASNPLCYVDPLGTARMAKKSSSEQKTSSSSALTREQRNFNGVSAKLPKGFKKDTLYVFAIKWPERKNRDVPEMDKLTNQLGASHVGIIVGSVTADGQFSGTMYDMRWSRSPPKGATKDQINQIKIWLNKEVMNKKDTKDDKWAVTGFLGEVNSEVVESLRTDANAIYKIGDAIIKSADEKYNLDDFNCLTFAESLSKEIVDEHMTRWT